MTDVTFTFRVDDSLKNEFTSLAKAHDRTGAQLLRDFMRDYVNQQQQAPDYDAWLKSKVEKARAEVRAGNVFSAEEVEAEASEWRARIRREMNDAES